MMDKLKKYWPEIVILATAVWAQLGPTISAFVQSHPHVATDLSLVAAFIARVSTPGSKQ